MNNRIKLTNFKSIFNSIKYATIILKDNEKNTPPNKPSNVLLGLIFSNFVRPINFPTMYENISKIIIIKINRLKFKKISLVKLKAKKNKKEIEIYINGIILNILKYKKISRKMNK